MDNFDELSLQGRNDCDSVQGDNNDKPCPNEDEEQVNSAENTFPGAKPCLTSRNKKSITINKVRISENIVLIENKINKLENAFQIGINDIRKAVHEVEEEKRSMELHIRSLEDSLIYCNTNNKEYQAMNEQLKMEICQLKESCNKLEETNKSLLDDNESIQSEHTDHLESIANKQRQNRIAKRSFLKWKTKLKKKNINLTLLLQAENKKLKDELIRYQEGTKQAFLRSAKTLNFEALSVFQNSNSRLLQSDYLVSDHTMENQDDLQSLTSDSSDQSPVITRSDNKSRNNDTENSEIDKEKVNKECSCRDKIFFQMKPKQKNKKIYPQDEFFKKYGTKESTTIPGRFSTVGIKDSIHEKIRLESRGEWIEPNPIDGSSERVTGSTHHQASGKSYIADYVPDALRRETRQIMTQLQKSKKQNLIDCASKSLNVCDLNNHLHICHCAPLPGKSVNCQYCTGKQNFNFSKMPLGSRPYCNMVQKRQAHEINNDADIKKSRNVVIKSLTPNKENKSKVIYQPVGSTVVIEKHI